MTIIVYGLLCKIIFSIVFMWSLLPSLPVQYSTSTSSPPPPPPPSPRNYTFVCFYTLIKPYNPLKVHYICQKSATDGEWSNV